MVRITVISLKNLIKKIVASVVILGLIGIICICIKKVIINNNFSNEKIFNRIFESEICFAKAPTLVANEKELKNDIEENKQDDSNIKENNEEISISEQKSDEEVSNNVSTKEIPDKLETNVIREKNLKESYNAEYNGVRIKNESDYTLSQEILSPNVEFSNHQDILIYHTHTCESYTPTNNNSYIASGNFRTTDKNYSVVKVGDELAQKLIENKYNVIHDSTYHDYPSYTGSYNRSLITVKNILNKNPNIQMVIDLHRDAIGNLSEYGPSVKIGEEKVAQLMFVIGTNGGGLEHNNWKNNLKYAIKIQEKANEMYPGLFRPIIVRNSRYNQNLAESACIIEVGATGNTLEECVGSMKYLAKVINKVM